MTTNDNQSNTKHDRTTTKYNQTDEIPLLPNKWKNYRIAQICMIQETKSLILFLVLCFFLLIYTDLDLLRKVIYYKSSNYYYLRRDILEMKNIINKKHKC